MRAQDSTRYSSVCTSSHGQSRSSRERRPLPHLFHRPVSTFKFCPHTRNYVNDVLCKSFKNFRVEHKSWTVKSGFRETCIIFVDELDVATDDFRALIASSTSSFSWEIRPEINLTIGTLASNASLTECNYRWSSISRRSLSTCNGKVYLVY